MIEKVDYLMTHQNGQTTSKKILEHYIPLADVNESSNEKRQLSGIHIWWARRPPSTSRASIFAALTSVPELEEDRKRFQDMVVSLADAQAYPNENLIERSKKILEDEYKRSPKVLDCFAGGGAIPLEAARLGCETYALDLNPVAHLIQLCTLYFPQKYGRPMSTEEYSARIKSPNRQDLSDDTQLQLDLNVSKMVNPLVEDIKRWANWLLNKANEEIGQFYSDPNGENIMGYIWARTAECPNPSCKSQMPLVHQWWLSNRDRAKIALKPLVDRSSNKISFIVVHEDDIDFDPNEGTIKRNSAKCLVCGNVAHNDYLQNEGQQKRIGAQLIVVIIDDPNETGKKYRLATQYDIENYKQSVNLLQKRVVLDNSDLGLIPHEVLPLMSGTFNVPLYGFDTWGSIYNERQLLSLTTMSSYFDDIYENILSETQNQEYAKAIVTYLSLAVDRLADYNSTICTWHNRNEQITHTFPRSALPMTWDYVESNPFSGSAGSWESAGISPLLRTVEICSVIDNPVNVEQGTATRLPYNDGFFDAVITDPPYYNYVPYADLSDFFYVWLNRNIGKYYPNIFTTPLSPKRSEITEMAGWDASRYAYKDKTFYEEEMTKAFIEVNRVLRTDGISVIVFAHKSTSAWETLINSLLIAGLIVTASWPLHTEQSSRQRAQGAGALASSIFIVCRKRIAETDGIYDDVRPRIKDRIRERLNFFWKQGIRGADFFISAIGPAVEVFGQYKTVRKLSGDVVTVAELLDIVQQEVADYALSQVMNGGSAFGPFDAATRFYIMYRWSYGKNKIEFDDGMRLAMALGAEVDTLMHTGSILQKSGSSVTLLNPYDREKVEKLGEPARDRMGAPLIDMVHRSALLWRAGKRDELARFVSDNVGTRVEALRAVAQALVNVLPDGDKEKQLYEGFLQGELPSSPSAQQRMFMDDNYS